MTNSSNPFRLNKPCADCPFRKDKYFHLAPGRREGIAESLRDGQGFTCHKTLDYNTDDGAPNRTQKSQECVGATGTVMRDGFPHALYQIAERLGLFDPSRLDYESMSLHDTLDEWVAHKPDTHKRTVTTDDDTIEEPEGRER